MMRRIFNTFFTLNLLLLLAIAGGKAQESPLSTESGTSNPAKKEEKEQSEKMSEMSEFEQKMHRLKDRAAVHISEKWRKGWILIYDCADLHFVCVDEVGLEDCKLARERAKKEANYYLPCAPLKPFASDQECVKMQYKMMFSGVNKDFCYNSKDVLLK